MRIQNTGSQFTNSGFEDMLFDGFFTNSYVFVILFAVIWCLRPLFQIPGHVPLSQLAVQGQPYFYVETPNKEKLFGRINKGFPLQVHQ